MTTIESILPRAVLDAFGRAAIEVKVYLSDDTSGTACISQGFLSPTQTQQSLEVISQRVQRVVSDMDPTDQLGIDRSLREFSEGFNKNPSKQFFSMESSFAVSLAVARAAASALGIPLWKHLGGATRRFLPRVWFTMFSHHNRTGEIQPFAQPRAICAIPTKSTTFAQAVQGATHLQQTLIAELKAQIQQYFIDIDGGLSLINKPVNTELSVLSTAIAKIKSETEQYAIGLDVNADALAQRDEDCYFWQNKQRVSAQQLSAEYATLMSEFSLSAIADPFGHYDTQAWTGWDNSVGSILTIGHDTQIHRPDPIVDQVGIRLLQHATVSELFQAFSYANHHLHPATLLYGHHYTHDDYMADVAVAAQADQLLIGGLIGTHHTTNINRLLEIEWEFGENSVYNRSFGSARH